MIPTSLSRHYCRVALTAAFVCIPLYAGPISPIIDLNVVGVITITETGGLNLHTQIWPTHKGDRFHDRKGADIVQQHNLDKPVPGKSGQGEHTFLLSNFYESVKVTDYQQKTGDPGTLFASAFVDGFMVESLADWLDANGFSNGNNVYQPDFLPLPGEPDLYFGVNLADLVTAGANFVGGHSFGEVFTIDSSGKLPALSMYTFSSTPLTYVPGAGWSGTLLAPGTQFTYAANHATSTVPEPTSWLLLGAGLATITAVRLSARRRRLIPQS